VISSIASCIEHTLLRADTTAKDIRKLCREARVYGFHAVCVNPVFVVLCRRLLRRTAVRIVTVIGFPLGATPTDVKAYETRRAVADGADEIDMVLPIGALRSKDYRQVRADIRAVRKAAGKKVLKVIIETAYLTRKEKVRACRLARESGADFVKTSTGFGPGGATAADVRLLLAAVGRGVGVKASGGIRTFADARRMLVAGASRIGSSSSVAIIHKSETVVLPADDLMLKLYQR
jgi:deoxyribose-phosphate aldolase